MRNAFEEVLNVMNFSSAEASKHRVPSSSSGVGEEAAKESLAGFVGGKAQLHKSK